MCKSAKCAQKCTTRTRNVQSESGTTAKLCQHLCTNYTQNSANFLVPVGQIVPISSSSVADSAWLAPRCQHSSDNITSQALVALMQASPFVTSALSDCDTNLRKSHLDRLHKMQQSAQPRSTMSKYASSPEPDPSKL